MEGEEVCVHVVSRVVQKRHLVEETGMVEMRRILRSQAVFAGLEVITFCFLANHFHLLLRLDPKTARDEVDDAELVRRFRVLYGTKRSPSLGVDAVVLERVLARGGERAEEVRTKMKARMGDISVFTKEFKTRFTFWHNARYNTVGTFWAERFRSVILEPGSPALWAVAAYIDLNPVRAGLVSEPQDYRFCGFGEVEKDRADALKRYVWLEVRRGRKRRIRGDDAILTAYAARLKRMCASGTDRSSPTADSDAVQEPQAAYGAEPLLTFRHINAAWLI